MESQNSPRKKRPLFFIIIVFFMIPVISLGTGFFIIKGKINNKKTVITISPTPFLPPADPNIKVDLKPIKNGREVILTISDFPSDVNSVEYELTYTTQTGLPRGVLGTIRVDSKSKTLEREIILGTCSSGKCVYDENVKEIIVTLKFNAESGPSKFQKKYSI